jgi:hypothetical protein
LVSAILILQTQVKFDLIYERLKSEIKPPSSLSYHQSQAEEKEKQVVYKLFGNILSKHKI